MESRLDPITYYGKDFHVSIVTGLPIPDDQISFGCNDCWNAISKEDTENDDLTGIDWKDLGDSGVLCPACAKKEEERYEIHSGDLE